MNGEFKPVKRWIWTIIPATLVALAGCNGGGGGAAAASGGSLLAVVNDDPISMGEFNNYLARKRSVQVLTPNGPTELQVAGSLALQGMRDLVNRKLLMQLAKDQGVAPKDADIKKELDFQTKRNPNFVKTLTTSGLSLEEINQDLALDLARFNTLTKGITVTAADVDAYIKANPEQFLTPAKVDLYWLVVKTDKDKASADQDLKAGQQFPAVAARYSTIPDARTNSGAYPAKIVDQLPDRVKEIANKLKVGGQSEWIKDGNNSVKFFLQNKTGATKIAIDETLKEAVRRQLAETRGTQANDLNKSLQDRLKGAKIDVKLAYLKDPWKRAFDSLKEAEAAPAAPAAPQQ